MESPNKPSRHAGYYSATPDVLSNDCACSHINVVANFNIWQDRSIHTYRAVVTNAYPATDRCATHHMAAISQITLMIYRRVGIYNTLLAKCGEFVNYRACHGLKARLNRIYRIKYRSFTYQIYWF